MRIFISYRRADASGHAGRLHDELQKRFGRSQVFMDISGIDAGEDFVQRIDAAIQSCDALIAVIGDQWLSDGGMRRIDDPGDFVRAEISSALQRGIPVVPVLVEGADMPSARDLPEPLKPLATRNALELSDARWAYDVERLISSLEKIGGASPAQPWRRWIVPALIAGTWLLTRSASDSAAAVAGEWSAEVAYSWGAKYHEVFSLKTDGAEVTGTASFLGVPRGIVRGALDGNRITFETTTQEVMGGDWQNPSDIVHRYRGTIEDGRITFTMQSEGGSSRAIPVEFVAERTGPPPS